MELSSARSGRSRARRTPPPSAGWPGSSPASRASDIPHGASRTGHPARGARIDAHRNERRLEKKPAGCRPWLSPPAGEDPLAHLDGTALGIVMLKPDHGGNREMNRPVGRPETRRLGLGRALCTAFLSAARVMGRRQMRLGALDRHPGAIPLYRSLGFAEEPGPPADARPDTRPGGGAICLRLPLADALPDQ